MNNFIIRKTIKNYKDTQNSAIREQYGKLSGIIGIICNTILCLSKIFCGIVFKSISILADGVNNLSDAGNSIITLIGFKLSAKPADKDHPFGHARYEYISGLLVSFLILMLGISLFKNSFLKILNPDAINFSIYSILILIFSIAVKFWMFLFNKNIAKQISSVAVMATAKDSLNDVIATSGVLLSIIIEVLFKIKIDGYTGLLVSGFVIYSGIGLISDTLNPLLGEAPKEDLIALIENKIKKYPSVIGIHDLVVHNYGPNKCFATVHVEVPAKQSMVYCHEIIDTIENDFVNNDNIQLVVHMDPVETDNLEVLELKKAVIEKMHMLSSDTSIHDFRVVFGENRNNLIFDVAVPVDFKLSDSEIKLKVDALVKEIDDKNNAVIRVDKLFY